MSKHWNYFKYVMRHKWYVFLECIKFGLIWRGIIHDWSKFLPDEWFPYAEYFYGDSDTKEHGFHNTKTSTRQFNLAWLKHQHRNAHHWQHWLLKMDEDWDDALDMPDVFRKEMLADWRGAGKAQGNPNSLKWYMKHRNNIKIHPNAREWIEMQLGYKI